jgi:endonuclease/exonuclease/phosphatase family metal-dependent hydrolase
MQVRVMFHNVAGFVRVRLGTPLPEFFARYRPDVLCLAEVPMDKHGRSPAVEHIAAKCDLAHRRVDRLHRSHIGSKGGHLGLAVLSRFPIVQGRLETFTDLDLDPPGREPHIKGVQCLRLVLERSGTTVDLFNLHLPAVHIFERRMDDPAFGSLHRELERTLWGGRGTKRAPDAIVVTGDFNNREVPLDSAFPELRLGRRLQAAVTARSTVLGLTSGQSDHILVSARAKVRASAIHWTTSDHAAATADLDIAGRPAG